MLVQNGFSVSVNFLDASINDDPQVVVTRGIATCEDGGTPSAVFHCGPPGRDGLAIFDRSLRPGWLAFSTVASLVVLGTLVYCPGHRGYEFHRRQSQFFSGDRVPLPAATAGFGAVGQGVRFDNVGVSLAFTPFIVDRDRVGHARSIGGPC